MHSRGEVPLLLKGDAKKRKKNILLGRTVHKRSDCEGAAEEFGVLEQRFCVSPDENENNTNSISMTPRTSPEGWENTFFGSDKTKRQDFKTIVKPLK